MKSTNWPKWRIITLLLLCEGLGLAQGIPDPGSSSQDWLASWSFNDTNTWYSDQGHPALSFTNLSASELGDWTALVLDSTNAAWLRYKVNEDDGSTNLTVARGTILMWFAPSWSGTNQGGSGPGQWGRLVEVGAYTTNASYGWWSLYVDPEGVNIYFSAQTNGSGTNYFSAPIAWTTNYWHMIGLAYASTNSALYVDGVLATNGPGVVYYPGSNVLSNGFCIGSDTNGVSQARGMFDDIYTYDHPLDGNTIAGLFEFESFYYYMNPMNQANLRSAPFTNTITPVFNAVTGMGNLQPVSTNTANCLTNSNIWFTNVSASLATNIVTLTFQIAGGSNDVFYDVFANALLGPTNSPGYQWAWMGQGLHCVTYTLAISNQPNVSAFLVLGTPRDSDGDGLTDAYENLVSKTDKGLWDTDGDGMGDGWEVQFGTNPLINESTNTLSRLNFLYDPGGRLKNLSGSRGESFGFDREGNVQTDGQ